MDTKSQLFTGRWSVSVLVLQACYIINYDFCIYVA